MESKSDLEITKDFIRRVNSGWAGITTSEDKAYRDMIVRNLNNNTPELTAKVLLEALKDGE